MNPMTVNGESWAASLSDGRTYSEDDTVLCSDLGRISPWSRMMELMEGAHITGLRIHVLGRTYTSVSRSERARWPSDPHPINYMCVRRMSVDAGSPGNVRSHHIGMEVELPSGMKVTTWVDVYTGNSWQQVRM